MPDDHISALERLAAMRASGVLTEEEFEAEKARVLRGEGGGAHWRKLALIGAGVAALALGGGWLLRQQVGEVVDHTKPQASDAASATASDAAAAMVSPSPATDPHAGAVVTGCRQGECTWEKQLTVKDVRSFTNGTLKLQEAYVGSSASADDAAPEGWSPNQKIDWEKDVVQTYVFCSTSAPGIAFRDRWDGGSGKWIGHLLDPFDVYGYNTASAQTYMKVCHQLDFFAPDITKRMKALGYQPGTRNEQVDLESPMQLAHPPASAADGEADTGQ